MKKRSIIFGGMMIAGSLLLLLAQNVSATSTAEQLDRVQQEKKSNENKLNQTEEAIDNLRIEQVGLQEYLNKVSLQMEESTQELGRIEDLIAQKEQSIADTQIELEEAKLSEQVQYEAMRKRIRFMYEKSQNLYLEILFSSDSFLNFLNQTEYIEKMTEYDRDMLENYQNLQVKIAQDEDLLRQEKESLEVLQTQAGEKNDAITELVAQTHANVQSYRDEIAAKEKQALDLEEEIRRQEEEATDLQERLQEEISLSRLAANSEIRDLSGMSFSATDLDMMAAIIECEAGGEPYTGKVAVGAVVLNRVRSSLFPNTVAGVILQKKQFSPVGSGRFAIVLARGANASCYEAAQDAMNGSSPVGNCVFFRTPIPGLTGMKIGGHIFY